MIMAKFIAIFSMRPNIGNTTIALNLGLALHRLGKNVAVLDADFSKPNMLEHLDLGSITPLDSVLESSSSIREAIFRHRSGLRIIPSQTSAYQERLRWHLDDLRSGHDIVIFDAPKEKGALKELLNQMDEAFIVHSPEYTSKLILDAEAMLKKARTVNLGVIFNKFHEGSISSIYELPVVAKIPFHDNFIRSFQKKDPLLHIYPKGHLAGKFYSIAQRLV